MRSLTTTVILISLLSLIVSFPSASANDPHAAIYIDGNSQFNMANGVTGGSGTISDPYVIDGWSINGYSNAIEVRNTDAYFVISNLNVTSNGESYGILLDNVKHATIWDCTITDNIIGINLQSCLDINIIDNTFTGNTWVRSDASGIMIDSENNWVNVTGNEFYSNNIALNAIGRGDFLFNLNNFTDNAIGIRLVSTPHRVIIRDNDLQRNTNYGIMVGSADGLRIENNSIGFSNVGILANGNNVNPNYIVGNIISNNGIGIQRSDANAFYIYHNDFINNTVQVQSITTAIWNDTYPSGGNYWSSIILTDVYCGVDQDIPGPDGIWDAAYVTGSFHDYYPLVFPRAIRETGTPSAPTNLNIAPGNGTASLSWSAPLSDGDGPLSLYCIFRSSDAAGGQYSLVATNLMSQTSLIDSALSNGVAYHYYIQAVNLRGAGDPSSPVAVTPRTTPNAPYNLQASPENGQVILTWSAPTSDGGAAIDYYVIYQDDLALSFHPTDTTTVITGLSNGLSYSYAVAAHNEAGIGPKSNSASATPRSVPEAPTLVSMVPGHESLIMTWAAPSDDGGSPITSYKLYWDVANPPLAHIESYDQSVHSIELTGLTAGTTYFASVTAVNSVGESDKPTALSTVPYTVPAAPTEIQATAGNAQVGLAWTAPANDGGRTIDYYVIYQDGVARNEFSTGVTAIITGLINGQEYSFSVAAHNLAGEGDKSSAVLATPASTTPSAPFGLRAVPGNENITLSWSAPIYSNASAITGYLLSYGTAIDSLTHQLELPQLTYLLEGLDKGTTYYFKVAAKNSAGWGANSTAASAAPFGVPSFPLGLKAVAGNGYVILNWSAPSYAGPGTTIYHLFRDGSLIWDGTEIVYLDMPVLKNVSFSYQMAAENSIGWGPNCTAVQATPFGVPDAPWGFDATAGDSNISLSWNPVNYSGPGNLTYHLFRDGLMVWSGVMTNYEDVGLINGHVYAFSVAASNSVGWGTNSTIVNLAPAGPPTAPSGLHAKAGNNFALLNWTAPNYSGPGTLIYRLFRNNTLIYSGTAIEYNDTNVLNFVNYSYQVAAENSIGIGPNSTVVMATPVPKEMTPSAPRNLAISPGNENLTLTWEAPLYSNYSAVLGYLISFGTSPSSLTDQISSDQLLCFLDGLNKGTTYYFSVKARNDMGWGQDSIIEPATPFGVPDAPTNLSAVAGDSQVNLSWTAPSYSGPGALTYRLFRDGALVWSGGNLSHLDTELTNGQTYAYVVSTSNDVGLGPNSTQVQATPAVHILPGVPTDFNVTMRVGYVMLTWHQPIDSGSAPILSYRIYRTSGSVTILLKNVTSGTSYNDMGISGGTTYFYKVCAYSSIGEGAPTELLNVITPAEPSPPYNFEPDTIFFIGIGLIGLIVLVDIVYIARKKRR